MNSLYCYLATVLRNTARHGIHGASARCFLFPRSSLGVPSQAFSHRTKEVCNVVRTKTTQALSSMR